MVAISGETDDIDVMSRFRASVPSAQELGDTDMTCRSQLLEHASTEYGKSDVRSDVRARHGMATRPHQQRPSPCECSETRQPWSTNEPNGVIPC